MNKHKHSLRKESAKPPGSLPEEASAPLSGLLFTSHSRRSDINPRLHQTGKRREEASDSWDTCLVVGGANGK